MVLRTRARKTNEEIRKERLEGEQLRAWYDGREQPVAHQREIAAPTQRSHDHVHALWVEFVSDCDAVDRAELEIRPGMKLPSPGESHIRCIYAPPPLFLVSDDDRDVFERFLRFLAMSIKGRLGEHPVVSTLDAHLSTLCAVLLRLANVKVPDDIRAGLRNYLGSPALLESGEVSTERREKHYANRIDIRILLDSYHADIQRFRTNRMRLQMSALTNLLSISAERIGALVESSCYPGKGEGLTWKDVGVIILPRIDAPNRPSIAVEIKVRLLKGGRHVDSFSKSFYLFPEQDADRPYCPVLPLLVMGIQDQVWRGISTPEDILCPQIPPTRLHVLAVKSDKEDLPVFREETRSEDGWRISDTATLGYNQVYRHLQYFSRLSGFQCWHSVGILTNPRAIADICLFFLQSMFARTTFGEALPTSWPTIPRSASNSARSSWLTRNDHGRSR